MCGLTQETGILTAELYAVVFTLHQLLSACQRDYITVVDSQRLTTL